MTKNHTLDELFTPAPSVWGFRGDPYLWQEMRVVLGGYPLPDGEDDLLHLLKKTFEQITNASIEVQQPIFVERFSHGGMSSGYVSAKFWIETGFPFLLESYRQLKKSN